MATITYRLEVDEELWRDWKDTVPRTQDLNDALVRLVETDAVQSADRTEREELVKIIAHLSEIERTFGQLGSRQSMSVGPVLDDVAELRKEVIQRGKGYGIVREGEPEAALEHEAREVEVAAVFPSLTDPYGEADDE